MCPKLRRFLCCGGSDEGRACGEAFQPSQTCSENRRDIQPTGFKPALQLESHIQRHGPATDVVCESEGTSSPPCAAQSQAMADSEREILPNDSERMPLPSMRQDGPKPSSAVLPQPQEQALLTGGEELTSINPVTRLDRISPVRLPAPSASSFVESHSPFMASAFLSTGRTSPPGPGHAQLASASAGGTVPPSLPRHMASTDVQISASLSEPLVHSSSSPCSHGGTPGGGGGGGLACYSGSTGTAVTANTAITAVTAMTGGTGGGGSGAGAAPPQSQSPLWTASAGGASARPSSNTTTTTATTATSATAAPSANAGAPADGGKSSSSYRPPSNDHLSPTSRERRVSNLRPTTVDHSGGSRLGRPELAVVGPAAVGDPAPVEAAATTAAAPAPAPTPAPAPAPATAPTPVSAVVLAAATASVPAGSSSSGGSRAGSALGVLGGMTRRLLHMVQDVGNAVSQVALIPGSQSRAASVADGAAAAAAAAGTGAVAPAASASGGSASADARRLEAGKAQDGRLAKAATGAGGEGGGGAGAANGEAGVNGPTQRAWLEMKQHYHHQEQKQQDEKVAPAPAAQVQTPEQPQGQQQRPQQQSQQSLASQRAYVQAQPKVQEEPPPQQQEQKLQQPQQPPKRQQGQQMQMQTHQQGQPQQSYNALQPQPQRPSAASIAGWVQPQPGGDGHSVAPVVDAAAAQQSVYAASRACLRAGSDSGSAGGAAATRKAWDELCVVQLPFASHPYGMTASTSRLAKNPPKDGTQVAMMQMLHFGSMSGRVPLQQLATLNVANLSREIRALHWIGQGGGGAVFQGVWQGAPVAVKFMLAARPEHVDATALEAVVSVAVGHPNVVTTYSFDVTRLTEASFMPEAAAQHRLSQHYSAAGGGGGGGAGCNTEDSSATALFNALMETDASLDPNPGTAHRARQQQAGELGHRHGGGGGGSQPASSYRVESLSMRVRRAQATAVRTGGGCSPSPTPGSADAAVAAAVEPGGQVDDPFSSKAAAGPAGGGADPRAAPVIPANQSRGPGQGSAAVASEGDLMGIESAFNSEEGFGDPDLTDNGQSWTVRHVLAYLKARPGMFMTHIIMEYCDRGSLLSAIKRGIFRMDGLPDDDGGPSSSSGGAGASSSGSGLRAAATTAAAAAITAATAAAAGAAPSAPPPEGPRFTKRVVLRALLRTARDVAQGMCHLHSNGIIHGDLKPGNVLLRGCRTDRRGFTALVSDFGLSKVTRGDKPLELNHWSTVTVMAPEVIMGTWLKASDVFSFGILLWQLVTGAMMPYGNATVQQVLMGVAQGVLKPEWPATAHPALVRLGKACVATSPEKRPSFDAIVKILIKIEQHVRNELRVPRDAAGLEPGSGSHPLPGGARNSRSIGSGNDNVVQQINRLRSSAM